MNERVWRNALGGGVILAMISLLGATAMVRSTAWITLITMSCAAVLYAIRRNRPSSRRPWFVLAAGLALFTLSNVLVHPLWAPPATVRIAADVVSMIAFSTLGIAALALVRCQVPGGDREGAIDGTIVMIALATLLSGTVFAPSAAVTTGPVGRVLIVVGPLMLASITASTLRLLFVGSTRVLSTWLVVSAAVAGLVGNVFHALNMTSASYVRGEWPDAFIAAAFLSVALGALHPSMRHLTEAAAPGEPRLTHARLAILAASLLSAPIAHIVASRSGGVEVHGQVPLLASIVLCLLVVWRLWRLVIEREIVRDEMRRQAVHDPLTGLPNRTLLLDRLEQALARSARSGRAVAVMFIDLNGFKRVNDEYGHGTGDELLIAVSGRIASALRDGDTLARLAGDEFVIVCEDMDETGAAIIGDHIVDALQQPFQLRAGDASIGVSVGIALSSDSSCEPATLLARSDAAMYHAKQSGLSAHALFDAELGAALRRRRKLEADLVNALERDELHLVYQPIFALGGEPRAVGVEALLRWTHPEEGPIPPSEFIPLADASGLIGRLGEWVLREACGQLVRWENAVDERPLFTMAVNISPRQLLDPDLPSRVRAVLEETGADATRLTLEVTETAVLDDQGQGVRTIDALKAMGIRIALDDFGTGFSSLTHLKQLPLDVIKIDRSFVHGIDSTWENHAIVEAVVGIARRLGVTVVGEGLETVAELDTVRALGCDFAQGFHLGRPALAADVSAALLDALPGAVETVARG